MTFKQRMKWVAVILGGLMVLGAAAGAGHKDDLTTEQRLTIAADCHDHPDSYRCQ